MTEDEIDRTPLEPLTPETTFHKVRDDEDAADSREPGRGALSALSTNDQPWPGPG